MEHLLELIVFTCTAAVASSSAATKTSCFAQPAYLGGRGSLTCYFPVDITAEKFSFNVRRAGRHDFDYKRDTVLDCDWIEGEQLCVTIKDGFTYDYHVSSRLTMIIPNVTLDHQGLYTCQVFKEATSNIQSCSLTVSERESSPRPIDGVIFGVTQTSLPTTLETPLEGKRFQTADLNIAAIVVPIVIGAVVVVAIVIVVYVVKRRTGQKINRAATTPFGVDESGTHYQERQPLTGNSCVTSLASTIRYDSEEEAAEKDRANGDNTTEKNGDDNGSEHRYDDGDERNNDENEHSKPGTSRDDKEMEDEEGAGATKKGLKKGPGALRNTLKKKFDLVMKHMKRYHETGVDNQRKVPDKRKSARRDMKEKMNMIHELQETYNGSEHPDDDGDERNNDENEHNKPGTSRDDKEMEDEEGAAATKKGLKKGPGALRNTDKEKFDLVMMQMKRYPDTGVDNQRKVPDKRKSARLDMKEKMNMIHELQETYNGSEYPDDDGDERNNDENEHNKPGTSRDDKKMEDEEGAGAPKKRFKKGPGALRNTLKKKFDSVVKQMKRNKEKGVEHRDDDDDERNNDKNEHSKSGISLDDKGKEDEEGPGATKDALKGMYDPVVKELEQNNEKGVDNLRLVPNKRNSAIRDPKDKGNTINLQEPEEKLNVIHEET